jgi:hypothetical protein
VDRKSTRHDPAGKANTRTYVAFMEQDEVNLNRWRQTYPTRTQTKNAVSNSMIHEAALTNKVTPALEMEPRRQTVDSVLPRVGPFADVQVLKLNPYALQWICFNTGSRPGVTERCWMGAPTTSERSGSAPCPRILASRTTFIRS